MFSIEELKLVKNMSEFPTNEEVLTAVKVFNALIDVGNALEIEMMTVWAVSKYQHYDNIAYARNLK